MEIIAVCGSVKFKDEMLEYRDEQMKNGKWVLLPENMDVDIQKIDDQVKKEMDKLHLRKIDCADKVLIWNRGGYVGESTRKEREYAYSKNKEIAFLENVKWETEEVNMNRDVLNTNRLDFVNDILCSNSKEYKIRKSYIMCNEDKLEEVVVYYDYITGIDLLEMVSLMERFEYDLSYIQKNEICFRQISPTLLVSGKYSGVLSEYVKEVKHKWLTKRTK